jgi:hypothetical protein
MTNKHLGIIFLIFETVSLPRLTLMSDLVTYKINQNISTTTNQAKPMKAVMS